MSWLEKKQFYDYDDQLKMLKYLKLNTKAWQLFIKDAKGYGQKDFDALVYIVETGSPDTFMRYDSAICETFLDIFERQFLTGQVLEQYELISQSKNGFGVVDYEDGSKEILTATEMNTVDCLGINIMKYNC